MSHASLTVRTFWRGEARGPLVTGALPETRRGWGEYKVIRSLTVDHVLVIFGLDALPVVRVDVQGERVWHAVNRSARLADLGIDTGANLLLVTLAPEDEAAARKCYAFEVHHSREALAALALHAAAASSPEEQRAVADELVARAARYSQAVYDWAED